MKDIKNRSVSFNVDDPQEKELYEYSLDITTNFSGFMKKLLHLHKNGAEVKPPGNHAKAKPKETAKKESEEPKIYLWGYD